jgi:hypothetical protein
MPIKPWHTTITPREDLRDNKPLDASEFAVHLDQVRDGRAPAVYQKPEQFFARTYLTESLAGLAAEVIRRHSGERTETSAVFNLATQFGGGKTHALTLLYHLVENGPRAHRWPGVARLLERSGMQAVPKAATAVFIGTEFDSLTGRGGDDGTPIRKTPWGEIAWQLNGEAGLAAVSEHERQLTAPAGDVIRRFLPEDKPCLILMDELMNYISRSRKSGLAAQLYTFLHSLSEEARGRDNLALVVSVPGSELEMTAEDQADYERVKKLLDRVGKAVLLAAEGETSEIIRRRLFEWDLEALGQDGRAMLPREARQTCQAYSDYLLDHRQQIPEWFPVDSGHEAFAAAYPFHPAVLSVFERKWQALPRFQRTRGVLRLLALWVARAYQAGFKGGQREALITLGSAPLDDPMFRAALFEQLGEARLEAAVTTDIAGKKDAHAVRLDDAAPEPVRKKRLHRQAATAIFFESNGGQARGDATVPEVRLSVAEPDTDIGNIETALEALGGACYYLSVERNRYRFGVHPNLNKLLADRRSNIKGETIQALIKEETHKVFAAGNGIERLYFPERSGQISDRPVLTLVVMAPWHGLQAEATLPAIDAMTREAGQSGRTFKSALIWAVAEGDTQLRDEARKVLAWEAIDEEKTELRLDESQLDQLARNLKRARADLKEAIWRGYKYLVMLGKDGKLRVVDLGLVHSSAARTMLEFILNRLTTDGDVETGISPNFLARNWSPVYSEWSTKAVRDAFFASPQFPRLLRPDVIKDTIARGVEAGVFAYVGKDRDGSYEPFVFRATFNPADVEISDDVYLLPREAAEAHLAEKLAPAPADPAPSDTPQPPVKPIKNGKGTYTITPGAEQVDVQRPLVDPPKRTVARRLLWSGEVPSQKWMNFYQKVLARFATGRGLKLTITVEVTPEDGISPQKVDETRTALRELGLSEDLDIE